MTDSGTSFEDIIAAHALHFGEEEACRIRMSLTHAEDYERHGELSTAKFHYENVLKLLLAHSPRLPMAPGTPRRRTLEALVLSRLDHIQSLLLNTFKPQVNITSANALLSDSTSESSKKNPNRKQIRFVEQIQIHRYSSSSSPITPSNVLNSFVSHKVRERFDLFPVYCQSLRCVLAPIRKPRFKEPVARLRTVFTTSNDVHQAAMSTEKDFDRPHLLAFLRAQLRSLSDHPCYTKESFDCFGKLSYKQWHDQETIRLERHLRRLQSNLQESSDTMATGDSCHTQTADMVADEQADYLGVESTGFPYFLQLYNSLLSYDRNQLLVDEGSIEILSQLVDETNAHLLEDAAQLPIDLDEMHANRKAGLDVLVTLSEFSRWLLDEYAERYCVRPLYRLTAHLAALTPLLRPTMPSMLETHLILSRTYKQLKKGGVVVSMVELKFLNQTVKALWRDVKDNFLSNILRYFSGENIACLVMMIKLLNLTAEVITWIKEKKNKSYHFEYGKTLRDLVLNSFRNHYQEVLYTVESKRVLNTDASGTVEDVDRLVPAKPSFLGANKTLTPLQLTNVINSLWSSLDGLRAFDEVLSGARLDSIETARQEYFNLVTSDVKFFVRKYLREYKTSAVLGLSIRYKILADEMHSTDDSLMEFLFGPLPNKWTVEVDAELREQAVVDTKSDQWQALDESRLYANSARKICESCEMNLQLAEALRFLEKRSDELKPEEQYIFLYGRIIGRSLKAYLEQVYNLFVEEFPPEQHAQLHDVYLRATFRFSQSGSGTKLVKPSQTTAKSKFKFTLGGKKPDRDKTPDDPLDAPENWEIKIWAPRVILSAKKTKKYRKARNTTHITPSMCIKVNSLEHIRTRVHLWQSRRPELATPFDGLLKLEKRIWNSVVGMLLYTMELYISAQLEYALGKAKKKLSLKVFRELNNLDVYIYRQLHVMSHYFQSEMFHRFCSRLWKTVLKSIDTLAGPTAEDRAILSVVQIASLDYFLDGLAQYLAHLSLSNVRELQSQKEDLMKLVQHNIDPEQYQEVIEGEFAVAKDQFEAELMKDPTRVELRSLHSTPDLSSDTGGTMSSIVNDNRPASGSSSISTLSHLSEAEGSTEDKDSSSSDTDSPNQEDNESSNNGRSSELNSKSSSLHISSSQPASSNLIPNANVESQNLDQGVASKRHSAPSVRRKDKLIDHSLSSSHKPQSSSSSVSSRQLADTSVPQLRPVRIERQGRSASSNKLPVFRSEHAEHSSAPQLSSSTSTPALLSPRSSALEEATAHTLTEQPAGDVRKHSKDSRESKDSKESPGKERKEAKESFSHSSHSKLSQSDKSSSSSSTRIRVSSNPRKSSSHRSHSSSSEVPHLSKALDTAPIETDPSRRKSSNVGVGGINVIRVARKHSTPAPATIASTDQTSSDTSA